MTSNPWVIIGWALITIFVLVWGTLGFLFIKSVIDQFLTNRKRRRANAGKVKCQETREKCTKLATRHTPNGFYCDEHEGAHRKKYGLVGDWAWSHRLAYTMHGNVERR